MLSRRHVLSLAAAVAVSSRASAVKGAPHDVRRGLAKRFADEGTTGTFAALKADGDLLIVSDEDRAERAILPASTFKIPNSIIALETGVVSDPDRDVFKWDGVKRAFPGWNQDHTLRSAIAASAVPVYQEIARKIAPERMQQYVDAFDYGNRNIGGGIDRFWLTGDLRISPLQQIRFLDKLRRGALPASKRAQDLTCDILPVTKSGNSLIRAKTGLVGMDDRTVTDSGKSSVGWLVGWAETGSAQTVFALNLDIREPRHAAARMPLAEKFLADIGAA
jgi:beta-lactamase class D